MRGFGGAMGTIITPQQSVEATMIVDLFDAKTHALLWRGRAQDTLSNNGGKNQKLVQNGCFQDVQAVAEGLVRSSASMKLETVGP